MSESLSKILYVEDEPDIQAVAKIALESVGGLITEVCSSGDEALEKVSAFNPELILLDVMMPNMDGPSTMKAIREIPEFSTTPVVFMTAKVQPQEVQALLALGALDVIAKPFDPMTLSDQVKKIWANRSV